MTIKWFVILGISILCCVWLSYILVRYLNTISQVTYTAQTGPILPELQWYEEIIITKKHITLIRNGMTPDTKVNAGVWELAVDKQAVKALFAQLQAIDRTPIKRIALDDPIDGGYTKSYTLVYASHKTLSLMYDNEARYTHGELIVRPIDAFIQKLDMSVKVASRYK